MYKESSYGNKNPLFVRLINKETSASDIINTVSQSNDKYTMETARKALLSPPNLDAFRKELEEAVRDLIKDGVSEEFKSFVNHYMEPSLVESVDSRKGKLGDSRRQSAYIKDEEAPWVEGVVCYNLSLYIKAFGLDSLKACKTCGKIFSHKGQYAVYCNEGCKKKKVG